MPFDRRVWQESKALTAAGFKVSVICPAGSGRDTEAEVVLNGVRILRYRLRAASGGPFGYLREYALALWHTLRLAVKLRREGPIEVVQACNPPDLLFLIAVLLRPFGSRFIFDHHDLVPELFLSRFAGRRPILHRLTRFAERITFAAADGVIATNDSYRSIALKRGKVAPERVVVVRSAPDLRNFVPRDVDPEFLRGKRFLLAYLGVMGPQDGVDYALRAIQLLREELGRNDFHCVFMGAGDSFESLTELSSRLGIDDIVEFTGWVGDDFIQPCLSSADVCLSPDPFNPLNDVSTMNKIVEYMAMGKPLVTFDLAEARVSAAEAAMYVQGNDVLAFAKGIDDLLEDPERRQRMGEAGRRRVEDHLSWDVSSKKLVDFYRKFLDLPAE